MHVSSLNPNNRITLLLDIEETSPPSSLEIEETAHEILSSSLPIKEKVEIFLATDLLLCKQGASWENEPTLPCTVSDEHATLNIDVPLSSIASWQYFQQLYSGGYGEETRDHLSIKLPPEYNIPTFETLLRPIDFQEEKVSFEECLNLCSLGSFLGGDAYFTGLDAFEPSLENIALLSDCRALSTFEPYRELASFMISQYLLSSKDIGAALTHLKNIEGFEEWATTFPIDLTLCNVLSRIDSSDLSMIGSLFPYTVKLEVFGPFITALPKEFVNLIYFSAHYAKTLTDISALNGSKHLSTLKLHGAAIRSLPLDCPLLTEVSIMNCSFIETFDPLQGSATLQTLRISGSPCTTLPEGCIALETVTIETIVSELVNLQALNGSLTLKTLILDSIFTPHLTLPSGCKNLTRLEITNTQISHLDPFKDSNVLKALKLSILFDIKEIPPYFPHLEELVILSCEKLKDLSTFDGSSLLRSLTFNHVTPSTRLPQRCPNLTIKIIDTDEKV